MSNQLAGAVYNRVHPWLLGSSLALLSLASSSSASFAVWTPLQRPQLWFLRFFSPASAGRFPPLSCRGGPCQGLGIALGLLFSWAPPDLTRVWLVSCAPVPGSGLQGGSILKENLFRRSGRTRFCPTEEKDHSGLGWLPGVTGGDGCPLCSPDVLLPVHVTQPRWILLWWCICFQVDHYFHTGSSSVLPWGSGDHGCFVHTEYSCLRCRLLTILVSANVSASLLLPTPTPNRAEISSIIEK